MWMLRLNMTDRTYKVEDVPEKYKNLGGRGLTSTLIYDEVDPQCHPLGPHNKLVFAPGIITGTSAPTSSRLSVGGKSPLTGGIKESNAGSSWAPSLAKMRIKAIVVEGQPAEGEGYWIAHVALVDREPKVTFSPADEYTGKNFFDVFPEVYGTYGHRVHIAGIGTSGDNSGSG